LIPGILLMEKPAWLNKKISLPDCRKTKQRLKELGLSTVCEQARCPNISQCFSRGTATFMIMGDICTRNCRFCGVTKGRPLALDKSEPQRVKQAVKLMDLEYVVITSPTRDDLEDGGAGHFSSTIKALRSLSCVSKIEVLIPDFQGDRACLHTVIDAGPDVINHNLETVPSLYSRVRSKAGYQRSLDLLAGIKRFSSSIFSKSGLMLGLGEKDREIEAVLEDLRAVDCDFLSIGQYLPPSRTHYPVQEYVLPEKFDFWQKKAQEMGFRHCLSGPYVRSSYKAHTYLENAACGGK